MYSTSVRARIKLDSYTIRKTEPTTVIAHSMDVSKVQSILDHN